MNDQSIISLAEQKVDQLFEQFKQNTQSAVDIKLADKKQEDKDAVVNKAKEMADTSANSFRGLLKMDQAINAPSSNALIGNGSKLLYHLIDRFSEVRPQSEDNGESFNLFMDTYCEELVTLISAINEEALTPQHKSRFVEEDAKVVKSFNHQIQHMLKKNKSQKKLYENTYNKSTKKLDQAGIDKVDALTKKNPRSSTTQQNMAKHKGRSEYIDKSIESGLNKQAQIEADKTGEIIKNALGITDNNTNTTIPDPEKINNSFHEVQKNKIVNSVKQIVLKDKLRSNVKSDSPETFSNVKSGVNSDFSNIGDNTYKLLEKEYSNYAKLSEQKAHGYQMVKNPSNIKNKSDVDSAVAFIKTFGKQFEGASFKSEDDRQKVIEGAQKINSNTDNAEIQQAINNVIQDVTQAQISTGAKGEKVVKTSNLDIDKFFQNQRITDETTFARRSQNHISSNASNKTLNVSQIQSKLQSIDTFYHKKSNYENPEYETKPINETPGFLEFKRVNEPKVYSTNTNRLKDPSDENEIRKNIMAIIPQSSADYAKGLTLKNRGKKGKTTESKAVSNFVDSSTIDKLTNFQAQQQEAGHFVQYEVQVDDNGNSTLFGYVIPSYKMSGLEDEDQLNRMMADTNSSISLDWKMPNNAGQVDSSNLLSTSMLYPIVKKSGKVIMSDVAQRALDESLSSIDGALKKNVKIYETGNKDEMMSTDEITGFASKNQLRKNNIAPVNFAGEKDTETMKWEGNGGDPNQAHPIEINQSELQVTLAGTFADLLKNKPSLRTSAMKSMKEHSKNLFNPDDYQIGDIPEEMLMKLMMIVHTMSQSATKEDAFNTLKEMNDGFITDVIDNRDLKPIRQTIEQLVDLGWGVQLDMSSQGGAAAGKGYIGSKDLWMPIQKSLYAYSFAEGNKKTATKSHAARIEPKEYLQDVANMVLDPTLKEEDNNSQTLMLRGRYSNKEHLQSILNAATERRLKNNVKEEITQANPNLKGQELENLIQKTYEERKQNLAYPTITEETELINKTAADAMTFSGLKSSSTINKEEVSDDFINAINFTREEIDEVKQSMELTEEDEDPSKREIFNRLRAGEFTTGDTFDNTLKNKNLSISDDTTIPKGSRITGYSIDEQGNMRIEWIPSEYVEEGQKIVDLNAQRRGHVQTVEDEDIITGTNNYNDTHEDKIDANEYLHGNIETMHLDMSEVPKRMDFRTVGGYNIPLETNLLSYINNKDIFDKVSSGEDRASQTFSKLYSWVDDGNGKGHVGRNFTVNNNNDVVDRYGTPVFRDEETSTWIHAPFSFMRESKTGEVDSEGNPIYQKEGLQESFTEDISKKLASIEGSGYTEDKIGKEYLSNLGGTGLYDFSNTSGADASVKGTNEGSVHINKRMKSIFLGDIDKLKSWDNKRLTNEELDKSKDEGIRGFKAEQPKISKFNTIVDAGSNEAERYNTIMKLTMTDNDRSSGLLEDNEVGIKDLLDSYDTSMSELEKVEISREEKKQQQRNLKVQLLDNIRNRVNEQAKLNADNGLDEFANRKIGNGLMAELSFKGLKQSVQKKAKDVNLQEGTRLAIGESNSVDKKGNPIIDTIDNASLNMITGIHDISTGSKKIKDNYNKEYTKQLNKAARTSSEYYKEAMSGNMSSQRNFNVIGGGYNTSHMTESYESAIERYSLGKGYHTSDEIRKHSQSILGTLRNKSDVQSWNQTPEEVAEIERLSTALDSATSNEDLSKLDEEIVTYYVDSIAGKSNRYTQDIAARQPTINDTNVTYGNNVNVKGSGQNPKVLMVPKGVDDKKKLDFDGDKVQVSPVDNGEVSGKAFDQIVEHQEELNIVDIFKEKPVEDKIAEHERNAILTEKAHQSSQIELNSSKKNIATLADRFGQNGLGLASYTRTDTLEKSKIYDQRLSKQRQKHTDKEIDNIKKMDISEEEKEQRINEANTEKAKHDSLDTFFTDMADPVTAKGEQVGIDSKKSNELIAQGKPWTPENLNEIRDLLYYKKNWTKEDIQKLSDRGYFKSDNFSRAKLMTSLESLTPEAKQSLIDSQILNEEGTGFYKEGDKEVGFEKLAFAIHDKMADVNQDSLLNYKEYKGEKDKNTRMLSGGMHGTGVRVNNHQSEAEKQKEVEMQGSVGQDIKARQQAWANGVKTWDDVENARDQQIKNGTLNNSQSYSSSAVPQISSPGTLTIQANIVNVSSNTANVTSGTANISGESSNNVTNTNKTNVLSNEESKAKLLENFNNYAGKSQNNTLQASPMKYITASNGRPVKPNGEKFDLTGSKLMSKINLDTNLIETESQKLLREKAQNGSLSEAEVQTLNTSETGKRNAAAAAPRGSILHAFDELVGKYSNGKEIGQLLENNGEGWKNIVREHESELMQDDNYRSYIQQVAGLFGVSTEDLSVDKLLEDNSTTDVGKFINASGVKNRMYKAINDTAGEGGSVKFISTGTERTTAALLRDNISGEETSLANITDAMTLTTDKHGNQSLNVMDYKTYLANGGNAVQAISELFTTRMTMLEELNTYEKRLEANPDAQLDPDGILIGLKGAGVEFNPGNLSNVRSMIENMGSQLVSAISADKATVQRITTGEIDGKQLNELEFLQAFIQSIRDNVQIDRSDNKNVLPVSMTTETISAAGSESKETSTYNDNDVRKYAERVREIQEKRAEYKSLKEIDTSEAKARRQELSTDIIYNETLNKNSGFSYKNSTLSFNQTPVSDENQLLFNSVITKQPKGISDTTLKKYIEDIKQIELIDQQLAELGAMKQNSNLSKDDRNKITESKKQLMLQKTLSQARVDNSGIRKDKNGQMTFKGMGFGTEDLALYNKLMSQPNAGPKESDINQYAKNLYTYQENQNNIDKLLLRKNRTTEEERQLKMMQQKQIITEDALRNSGFTIGDQFMTTNKDDMHGDNVKYMGKSLDKVQAAQFDLSMNQTNIPKTQKKQSLLGGSLDYRIGNFLTFGLAQKVFGTITQTFKQLSQNIKELDKAMVNLKIVTGGTNESTKTLMKTYNKMGFEMGRTTTEVAQAANDWLRAGYTGKQASELVQASMYLSTLGMMDSAKATEALISVLKGWKLQTKEVEGVVDKLVTVDMSAATSAGDIATAMAKVNNLAQSSGLSMDTLIGTLTTGMDVTQQSAETVGTAWRTILSRIRNVKAGKYVASVNDKSSAGYNEGDWESLNDVEKVLKSAGVSLRDSKTGWRSVEDILNEIASKWESYSDITKSAISTAVAGTRQQEQFNAIMSNWKSVERYSNISKNSQGNAVEKMTAYTDSIEASKKRLTSAMEGFALDTNWIGEIIKKANSLLSGLISSLSKLDKTIMLISIIIGAKKLTGSGGSGTFLANMPRLTSGIGSLGNMFVSAGGVRSSWDRGSSSVQIGLTQEEISSAQKTGFTPEMKGSLKNAGFVAGAGIAGTIGGGLFASNISKMISKSNHASKEEQDQAAATGAVVGSTISSTIITAMPTIKSKIIAAVVMLVAGAITGIVDLIQTAKEQSLKDVYNNAKQTYDNQVSAYSKNIDIVTKLSHGVNKFGQNMSLTEDEYSSFLAASNELGEAFPQLVTRVDDAGNKIINLGNSATETKDALESIIEASELRLAYASYGLSSSQADELKEQKRENASLAYNSRSLGDTMIGTVGSVFFGNQDIKDDLKAIGSSYDIGKWAYFGTGNIITDITSGAYKKDFYHFSDEELKKLKELFPEKYAQYDQKSINENLRALNRASAAEYADTVENYLKSMQQSRWNNMSDESQDIVSNILQTGVIDVSIEGWEATATRLLNIVSDLTSTTQEIRNLFTQNVSEYSSIYAQKQALENNLSTVRETLASEYDSKTGKYSDLANDIAEQMGYEIVTYKGEDHETIVLGETAYDKAKEMIAYKDSEGSSYFSQGMQAYIKNMTFEEYEKLSKLNKLGYLSPSSSDDMIGVDRLMELLSEMGPTSKSMFAYENYSRQRLSDMGNTIKYFAENKSKFGQDVQANDDTTKYDIPMTQNADGTWSFDEEAEAKYKQKIYDDTLEQYMKSTFVGFYGMRMNNYTGDAFEDTRRTDNAVDNIGATFFDLITLATTRVVDDNNYAALEETGGYYAQAVANTSLMGKRQQQINQATRTTSYLDNVAHMSDKQIVEEFGDYGITTVEAVQNYRDNVLDDTKKYINLSAEEYEIELEKFINSINQSNRTAYIQALQQEASLMLSSYDTFSNVDLGDNGVVDTFKEFASVVESVATAFDKLNQAQRDYLETGKLNLTTVTQLIGENKDFAQLLTYDTVNGFRLVDNAEEKFAEITNNALLKSLQAVYTQVTNNVETALDKLSVIQKTNKATDAATAAEQNHTQASGEARAEAYSARDAKKQSTEATEEAISAEEQEIINNDIVATSYKHKTNELAAYLKYQEAAKHANDSDADQEGSKYQTLMAEADQYKAEAGVEYHTDTSKFKTASNDTYSEQDVYDIAYAFMDLFGGGISDYVVYEGTGKFDSNGEEIQRVAIKEDVEYYRQKYYDIMSDKGFSEEEIQQGWAALAAGWNDYLKTGDTSAFTKNGEGANDNLLDVYQGRQNEKSKTTWTLEANDTNDINKRVTPKEYYEYQEKYIDMEIAQLDKLRNSNAYSLTERLAYSKQYDEAVEKKRQMQISEYTDKITHYDNLISENDRNDRIRTDYTGLEKGNISNYTNQAYDYINKSNKQYSDQAEFLQGKLQTYNDLLSDENIQLTADEQLEYMKTINEIEEELSNMDDERIQQTMTLMENIGASSEARLAEYAALMETADNYEELIEYTKKYNDVLAETRKALATLLDFESKILDFRMSYLKLDTNSSGYQNIMQLQQDNAKQQILFARETAIQEYTDAFNEIVTGYKVAIDENGNYLYTESQIQEMINSGEIESEVLRDSSDFQTAINDYITKIQAYGTLISTDFDNQLTTIKNKVDLLIQSKPEEFPTIESANEYYGKMSEFYDAEIELSEKILGDTEKLSMMTDEEIKKIVDAYNEAAKAALQNQIDQTQNEISEAEKRYQALTANVNKFIDTINKEKEIVTDVYDKELEKLNDKNEAIERTNKLIELQNNLMKAQEEKERVYRAGIGWVYESNRTKVKEAETAIKDFYRQDEIDDLNNAKEKELEILEDRIENWNKYLEMLEEKYKEYEDERNKVLTMDLLDVETWDQAYTVLQSDMEKFVDYFEKNKDNSAQEDFYNNYTTNLNTFFDTYSQQLERLDKLKQKEVSLLSLEDYIGYNDSNGTENPLDAIYSNDLDYLQLIKNAYDRGDMEAAEQYLIKRNNKIIGEGLTDLILRGETGLDVEDLLFKYGLITNSASARTQTIYSEAVATDTAYLRLDNDSYSLLGKLIGNNIADTLANIKDFTKDNNTTYNFSGGITVNGVNNVEDFYHELINSMSRQWSTTKNGKTN